MTGPWPSISGSMRGQIDDAPIVPIYAKFPDTVREYTVTLPAWAEIGTELIASATLACAPSGSGEMQISGLTIENNELTYTASGGQPGRWYSLKFLVTMTDGTVFSFIGTQPVTPVLPTDQPTQVPPNAGFGTPITGVFVGMANSVYSTVASPFLVLKASAGVLFAVSANITQTGWVLLFDAATVPSNGAVSPRRAWFINNETQETLDQTFNPPLQMVNGAVLAFSTTGPFTLTIGGSVGQFSGEIV